MDVSQPIDAVKPQATAASERHAWYVVFLLFLGYTLSFVDRQILTLLVDPISQDLGLTDTQFSLLHGLAFALFYAFLGLPSGWLVDRYDRRLIAGLGIALCAPLGIAAPLEGDPMLSLFCINIIGLGLGPTLVAVLTDNVFGGGAGVAFPLATVAALLAPIAAAFMFAGLRAYGQGVIAARAWSDPQ